MHKVLPKCILGRMSDTDLRLVGRTRENLRGLESVSVSMLRMSEDEISKLREVLVRIKADGARMMKPMIADIDRWLRIVQEGVTGEELPRTLRQFADLLTDRAVQNSVDC